jgi:hypothetical protein
MDVFDFLPREIVVEIFDRVCRSSLIRIIMVCKYWNSIAQQQAVRISGPQSLRKACRDGDHVSLLAHTQWTKKTLNNGLYESCKVGRMDTAKGFIKRGATDKNRALFGACLVGNLELAKFIVAYKWPPTKEKNGWRYHFPNINYQFALCGACRGCHKEVIEWLIGENRTLLQSVDETRYYLESAFDHLCRQKRLDLVRWMILKRYDFNRTMINFL